MLKTPPDSSQVQFEGYCKMDNSDVSEVEEGEIVDYTPLERPVTYSAVPKIEPDHPNSDDTDAYSDSGSDDSDSPCFRAKRHKTRNEPIVKCLQPQPKKNKYDIWCSELQESALTDNLINIDVANKNLDRSRNVESYDYSLAYSLHDNDEETKKINSSSTWHPQPAHGNKRRFNERGSIKERLGRRDSGSRSDSKYCEPRHLLNLRCNVEDCAEDLAADIADKLCEQKESLILRVIQVLGNQKAVDLFEKTKKVEEAGGLMIMNGQRRRTPGGTFLFLLKKDDNTSQEKKRKIFEDDAQIGWQQERRIRKKRKADNFKKSVLPSDQLTDMDLPTLLTRAELAAAETDKSDEHEEGEAEITDCDEHEEGEADITDKEDTTNPPPPPSPATDGRDNSSDGEDRTGQLSFRDRVDGSNRHTVSYDDDDFLDLSCTNMDVF